MSTIPSESAEGSLLASLLTDENFRPHEPQSIEETGVSPVMIENPTWNDFDEMHIVFADGHVNPMWGDQVEAFWNRAVELAASAQERGTPITREEWQAVQEEFGDEFPW